MIMTIHLELHRNDEHTREAGANKKYSKQRA